MQGEPDATMPVPGGPAGGSPGGDPTMPVEGGGVGGVGGDPTVPVTQPGYGGGPGGPGAGGGGFDEDDEEGDRRKLWMIAGGVLALGLLIGALVAVLASGGGDDNASSTTSSSTSTSTTTTSTPTTTTPATQPAGPSILQFAANPSPYNCPGNGQIALTWSTQNTTGVTISIDGGGPYANYGPTGNAQVPFTCPATQHTYLLTANGTNGQKPQSTKVVQGIAPPSTTSSSGP
jgi:hypothetical protein